MFQSKRFLHQHWAHDPFDELVLTLDAMNAQRRERGLESLVYHDIEKSISAGYGCSDGSGANSQTLAHARPPDLAEHLKSTLFLMKALG